jgi:glycogen debranching enzyme
MPLDVLVDGYTCYVTETDGSPGDSGGLFHRDTRFLSSHSIEVEGVELERLGAERQTPASRIRRWVSESPVVTELHDVDESRDVDGPRRTSLVVESAAAVREGWGLVERVTVRNHGPRRFSGRVLFEFDVDFADIFEVRGVASGVSRERVTSVDADVPAVQYWYEYETAVGETTAVASTVAFDRPPETLEAGSASFTLDIAPQGTATVASVVRPDVDAGDEAPSLGSEGGPAGPGADSASGPSAESRAEGWPVSAGDRAILDRGPTAPVALPVPETGSERHDRTLSVAAQDLTALASATAHGPVPLAGVPWYATVFGRDSLLTAYQVLPVEPAMARGTLRYLAARQGTERDAHTEEEPGKMFHEMRQGELARRELIPHTPYYGTVDATPLWVVLLDETHRWTGDDAFVTDLSDSLDRALGWISDAVDRIGDDPFCYYTVDNPAGLNHKAWKDSDRGVQFADGSTAAPPIASVEVQGYVYDAYRRAARLYREVLGDPERARELGDHADHLAARFDESYWLPDRSFYAAALDGDGRPVDTDTSNVGQALWGGIVPESRVDAVVDRLFSEDLYSGWGIRTMSATAAGYSPVSYHEGSVWPHDSAFVTLGLARYGRYDAAGRLGRAVFDAASNLPENRIPEVVCGFDASTRPTTYPASCEPQAWAAGTPYAVVRAVFGASPGEDGEAQADTTPCFLERSALDVFGTGP